MLQPVGDRVAVIAADPEAVSAGGIVIPDIAKGESQQGTVCAVGNGRLLESGSRVPPPFNVGDVVVYGKRVGVKLKVGDKEYVILREGDIIAILTRDVTMQEKYVK